MRRLGACMLGIVGMTAAPGHAQDRPNLDGERTLAEFARCVAHEAPRQAESFIATTPDSPEEGEQFASLLKSHGKCMAFPSSSLDEQVAAQLELGRITMDQAVRQLANERRQMAISRQALRGAIAERLYLSGARRSSGMAIDAVTSEGGEVGRPAGYLVARCAAHRDPAAADRLVRSKRLSTREAQAARDLASILQDCARGRGHVEMSGTAIHGWMAEALYNQHGAETAERH